MLILEETSLIKIKTTSSNTTRSSLITKFFHTIKVEIVITKITIVNKKGSCTIANKNNNNNSQCHLDNNNNTYILVGSGCPNLGNNLLSYFNISNLISNSTTGSGQRILI